MPLRNTDRRPLRAGILATTVLTLALGTAPAHAETQEPVEVRDWSAVIQTIVDAAQRLRALIEAARAATPEPTTAPTTPPTTAPAPEPTRPTPAPTTAPTTAPPTEKPAQDWAERILQLTNKARATSRTCGGTTYAAAKPLVLEKRLNAAAQAHADDMSANSYLSHTGLDGSSVGDRITRAGYSWSTYGENIAVGYETPEQVMEGWLTSAGHCANIMRPNFTQLGVGQAPAGGRYRGHYWAQNFAAPR